MGFVSLPPLTATLTVFGRVFVILAFVGTIDEGSEGEAQPPTKIEKMQVISATMLANCFIRLLQCISRQASSASVAIGIYPSPEVLF